MQHSRRAPAGLPDLVLRRQCRNKRRCISSPLSDKCYANPKFWNVSVGFVLRKATWTIAWEPEPSGS